MTDLVTVRTDTLLRIVGALKEATQLLELTYFDTPERGVIVHKAPEITAAVLPEGWTWDRAGRLAYTK